MFVSQGLARNNAKINESKSEEFGVSLRFVELVNPFLWREICPKSAFWPFPSIWRENVHFVRYIGLARNKAKINVLEVEAFDVL